VQCEKGPAEAGPFSCHTETVRLVLAVGIMAASVACGSADAETQLTERPRARLVIVSTEPLVVRGLGFEPRERVKLLVTVGGRAAPTGAARASRAGRFSVRLRASTAVAEAIVVQAIGARGSRAMTDQLVTTDTLAPAP
jgi:hypothetical protein